VKWLAILRKPLATLTERSSTRHSKAKPQTELKRAIVGKINIDVELPHLRRRVDGQDAVHGRGVLPGEGDEEVRGGGPSGPPPVISTVA